MNIKIVNGKLALFTRSCGRIKNFRDLYESYHWRMRCYRHNRWIKASKFLVKHLAMALLKRSNIYMNHLKRYKAKPYIQKLDKPYKTDWYHALKGEYNTDIKYYIMRMNVAEYTFWGNSEYEIYLNIIKRMAIESFQFPFCKKGGLIGPMSRKINKHKGIDD